MSDKDDRCLVNVTTQAEALSSPSFLIKAGDRYYVTLAVWEYDPGAPDLTAEQKKDIEELARTFEEQRQQGDVHQGVLLKGRRPHHFMSTRPPGGGHS